MVKHYITIDHAEKHFESHKPACWQHRQTWSTQYSCCLK